MADPADTLHNEIRLAGFFLQAAARAFVHLRMLAGPEMEAMCAGVEPMGSCEYERFATILARVAKRFRDMDPVLEQLGIQMMTDWYEHGPGKSAVSSGVGFLRFQTGSEGYRSVVSGPASAVGDFTLESLDLAVGKARVRSSTPFPRAMERGVLIGGMRAPGDLAYVAVDNAADASAFDVTFR
jgi:hypothetical protein